MFRSLIMKDRRNMIDNKLSIVKSLYMHLNFYLFVSEQGFQIIIICVI